MDRRHGAQRRRQPGRGDGIAQHPRLAMREDRGGEAVAASVASSARSVSVATSASSPS
jgi:hypothetical protein